MNAHTSRRDFLRAVGALVVTASSSADAAAGAFRVEAEEEGILPAP